VEAAGVEPAFRLGRRQGGAGLLSRRPHYPIPEGNWWRRWESNPRRRSRNMAFAVAFYGLPRRPHLSSR